MAATNLAEVLSWVARRVKGDGYQIDTAIPDSYLLGVAGRRAAMRGRGVLRFPRCRPTPYVGPGVRFRAKRHLTFGPGTTFGRNVYVDALSREGVRFGSNVSVGVNTRIECIGSLRVLGAGMFVGDNVGLGTDCYYGCAGGIRIGSDTIIGNFVSMHSENHDFARRDVPIRLQPLTHLGITIGRDCWLGAKVTVLDGARIGDGSVVAAGSVVVAGVYEPDSILAGAPARRIRARTSDSSPDLGRPD